MRYTIGTLALLALAAGPALAQSPVAQDNAAIVIPASSLERPEDLGMRAHTNHLLLAPRGKAMAITPGGLTPAQIRTAYSLATDGGWGTIAIVDAYHYPTALDDFNKFSTQFGLPTCTSGPGSSNCFQVVYAAGSQPPTDCGWAQEAALDIEWAHAMAPGAKIILVEAASNSFSDLFAAVQVANGLVSGGGQVSMSWGGGEFSGETYYDTWFAQSKAVYFAASGDTGGKTIYPGVSPNVVSAGGTTLKVDGSGNRISETAWSGSGGGSSRFEGRPFYQNVISGIAGSKRGVPDMSFDADPNTGVSVYDSTSCQGYSGWLIFGGTSVSSPALAGVVNLAGMAASNTGVELSAVYANLGNGQYGSNFFDITSGRAGSKRAATGWDFVTGLGSPTGLLGK